MVKGAAWIWVHARRKPTQTQGERAKIHTKKSPPYLGTEPRTFLLQGTSVNHHATVPAKPYCSHHGSSNIEARVFEMSGNTRAPKPFFYRTVVNVRPLAPGASCPQDVFIHSVMFWHKIHFARFRKQSLPFALKLDTIYDPPWWMPGYLQR